MVSQKEYRAAQVGGRRGRSWIGQHHCLCYAHCSRRACSTPLRPRTAQLVREEADALESEEMDACLSRQQERWAAEDARLSERQRREAEAMDERIGRMFAELKQRREAALAQLLHR